MHHQVINAHGHQVDANCVVPIHGLCNFEFGADTIRRGYQYRIFIAGFFQVEQRAEAPQIVHGTFSARGFR